MTTRTLTSLALQNRAAEWATVQKAGTVTPSRHAAILDASTPHKSILDAIVTNPDSVTKALHDACGRLPVPVALGIPASWVLLRVVDLPESSPQELHGMIELQVDKYAPFPAEEATFHHEILDTANGRCRILMGAIRTKTADAIGACLAPAGLAPKWIDINLLAWWRLLREAGKVSATGSHAYVVMDDGSCDLIVATAGIPVAVRALSGLEDLSPEERAAEIAQEAVFTMTSLDLDRTGQPLSEISVWHRGESPDLLKPLLREHFPVPVHLNDLGALPTLAEGLLRRALDPATHMDLAPAAWRQAETARRTRRLLAAAILVLVGAWALAMAILFGGLQYQKQRLGTLEATLTELTPAADKARAVREQVHTLQQYIERKHSALECLREVSDLLPPGIDLKSMAYHKAKTVELSGEADAAALVFDFKKEMEKSDMFVKTELSRIQRNPQGREVFKLIGTLPGGERP